MEYILGKLYVMVKLLIVLDDLEIELEERTGEAGTWRAQETGGEGERAAGPPP